jgi:hypothetical protein
VQGIAYLIGNPHDLGAALRWVGHGIPIRGWSVLWILAGLYSIVRALTPPQRHTDVAPVVAVVFLWAAIYFVTGLQRLLARPPDPGLDRRARLGVPGGAHRVVVEVREPADRPAMSDTLIGALIAGASSVIGYLLVFKVNRKTATTDAAQRQIDQIQEDRVGRPGAVREGRRPVRRPPAAPRDPHRADGVPGTLVLGLRAHAALAHRRGPAATPARLPAGASSSS